MRALVEATLAKLPSKESMTLWPPEAVAAVEVLTKLALILCDELEARDKRIAELEEEVKELKSKLNINSGNSGIFPSQDPFRPKGKGGKKKDEDNSDKSEPNQGGDSPDKPGAEDQGEIPSQLRKSSPNAGREAKKGTRTIARNSAKRRT